MLIQLLHLLYLPQAARPLCAEPLQEWTNQVTDKEELCLALHNRLYLLTQKTAIRTNTVPPHILQQKIRSQKETFKYERSTPASYKDFLDKEGCY